MNYQRIYDEIIENRKQNIPECYSEKHHIVPKSLGGTNKKDNIVKLTAREHFICHLLLTKIYKEGTYEWAKMISAFCRMLQSNPTKGLRRYCPSKWYAYLRENMSIAMSINQGGEKNSQYGKHWIINPETGEKKSLHESEIQSYLDNGWIRGRTLKPKRERKPRKERAKISKQNYSQQKEKHGKKYQFTNIQTGEVKQVWLDEIDTLDSTWISAFYILDCNKEDISKMLLDKMAIGEVAQKYNVSYDNFYSWYRKHAKDIKLAVKQNKDKQHTRVCLNCGKTFIHRDNRQYCCLGCYYKHKTKH